MHHINIKIFGKVQGVFFRYFAAKKAKELGITGFARNETDGAVLIEAEGEQSSLEDFLEWCRKGPPSAKVGEVQSEWSDELKNFTDFIAE